MQIASSDDSYWNVRKSEMRACVRACERASVWACM